MAGIREMRLRLIALGGTIAFAATSDGAAPQLEGEDLVAELLEADQVDVQDLARISSIAMTDEHLLGLVRAIVQTISERYDAVVVTHGTDTLEETAYFLALTIPRDQVAIVLTGAMRHSGQIDSDGPANLREALRVAQVPGLAALGPVVVMAGEVHPARFVTKSHTSKLTAFTSSGGPIGHTVEERTELWYRPLYEDYLGALDGGHLPRVELVTMFSGCEGATLRAAVETQPAGLVIAGLGGGHVPPRLLGCIDDAVARRIPVVIASRCADGPTLRSTYAVPGTEIDLQARGALMSGMLSAPKARLRLAVALANGLPPDSVFPAGVEHG